MYMRDRTYHFVGIGGIGVSAVARVLHAQGVAVQGSDVRDSQLTHALRELGIPVFIGHDPRHIEAADVVVHSTAVPRDNVERRAARDAGKPEAHRSDMLALCLRDHDVVGVTGTHGKGTVSAMISHVLVEAQRDPTFVIGGLLNNYGINARAGAGGVAVAEIDESDRSHLNLRPHHVVVNNLEVDHLNFYDGLEDIIDTMARFIGDNPELRTLALNFDDAGVHALARRLVLRPGVRVLRYGTGAGELEFSARDVVDRGDLVEFDVWRDADRLGHIALPIPGAYNADNAVGALAIAMGAFDVPFETARHALTGYRGLENRFAVRRAGAFTLVKDYISHPTGIRRVLESARNIEHKRVWAVFKPYRFTLMRYHGEEYAEVFAAADETVITTMYSAGEHPIDGIDTEWFVDMLSRGGCSVHHVPDNALVIDHLERHIEPGDMIIFFGGDDFFCMADAWADRLEAAES